MNKKIYVCGGYVRDYIISKIHNTSFNPNDKDFVAIGYTIEEMVNMGYKQVGKEFPVFLDQDGNEIALARTEKKTGNRHTDFEFDFNPNISLKDDALRRNHTINSLYLDEETGEIIDYVNGQEDIKNKIIRHTSEYYIQDPLRVLISARQSAQLGFIIASETMDLMKQMVSDGMLNHLTPERVWKETEKALTQGYDSRKYFETLNECGALEVLFPEVYTLVNTAEQVKYHPSGNTFKHTMIALDRVKDKTPLEKFAVLCHDLGKGNTPEDILPKHNGHDERGGDLIDSLCDKIKTPNSYREFAKMFCKHHMRIAKFLEMNVKKQYDVVKELSDNFKSSEKLVWFGNCFYADYFGEDVKTEYVEDNMVKKVNEQINTIYSIMKGVSLKDFDETTRNNLLKFKGEKFGLCYREAMISYLKHGLSKAKGK